MLGADSAQGLEHGAACPLRAGADGHAVGGYLRDRLDKLFPSSEAVNRALRQYAQEHKLLP
jgi:hypothetical protein